ncbi:Uncharacterized conserved protein [Phaffia rhodozyma]|uniref:Fanconi-associated nuclease n=1 Tax=Phaffia rhodozyma TaxID=264483 RepID=A0A0F7SF15_PHARH|nr:Uncharacterized conserved protein [Phaffia rhodozyma]
MSTQVAGTNSVYTSISDNTDETTLPNVPTAIQAGLLEYGTEGLNGTDGLDTQVDGPDGRRVSMYVAAFEDMLETVLAQESYLFSSTELKTFERYKLLSYDARYILVRLLLRIPRVHRVEHLVQSYTKELGSGIPAAVDELCVPFQRALPNPMLPPPTATSSALNPPPLPCSSAIPSSIASIKEKDRVGNGYDKGKERAREEDVVVIDLTEDEEIADPELARAMRISLLSNTIGHATNTPTIGSSSSSSLFYNQSDDNFLSSAPVTPQLSEFLSPSIQAALSLETQELDLSHFCSSADGLETGKLLRCLRFDELKDIARGMNIWKNGLTYDMLVQHLLSMTKTQSVLPFLSTSSQSLRKPATTANKRPALKQATLSFGGVSVPPPPLSGGIASMKREDSRARLLKSIKNVMGRAVVVNDDIRKLWNRLNLVFYRSTSAAPSILLPQILSRANRWHYPKYIPTRTLSLFPDRASLVSYEQALLLEVEVDDALGEQETLNGRQPFSKSAGPNSKINFGGALGRKEGAMVVRAIWEVVWDRWKECVRSAKERDQETCGPRAIADRFQPGHVLTRIIAKGANALGVLHDYDTECRVLKALLDQKVWRRGKRGAWYERLALVLMTHYKGDQELDKKEQALDVCLDGLEDEDTHLIYRPSLIRRLTRLEKQLKIPARDCHRCEGELKVCETVTLGAQRVRKVESGLDHESDEDDDLEDQSIAQARYRSRSRSKSRSRSVSISRSFGPQSTKLDTKDSGASSSEAKKPSWSGKSLWVGRNETEVGVEQWVLEQWEDKGWKGFHSEGSIITTIFGLLFWDIFFAVVPGAFETAFQTAPLDLGEDTFALARAPLISDRLNEIERGNAGEILSRVDDREREHETMCAGVSWNYQKQDLLDIVDCLGGLSLSIVCRMLCEEYGHRTSGVPDLLVWHVPTLQARFIEVKGPGDQLSSTQKIWIDVMLSAGIDVEVCRVVEKARSFKRVVSGDIGVVQTGGGGSTDEKRKSNVLSETGETDRDIEKESGSMSGEGEIKKIKGT